MRITITSLLFLISTLSIYAQEERSPLEPGIDSMFYGISASVYIDSLTISASRSGFSIQDFINLMLEDESFYQAFKNLRTLNYSFNNDIEFFDKKGKLVASYQGECKQSFVNDCRSMEVITEDIQGTFLKKGNYKHYTTRLYDRVFITHDTICNDNNATEMSNEATSNLEHQITMLKKMIFSPGVEADMPLVGEKMAIFSDKMSKYYDYSISSTDYKEKECYLFSVNLKPEFRERKKKKTIIKYLNTYFSKDDLQVVSRNYKIQYKNQLYSFDVDIDILLDQINGKYVPVHIDYDGYWDLAFKKPEIARFTVKFFDFL